MYIKTGKPSVAKFKARLVRIHECCESGEELALRWNPKGRNFQVQRDMIKFFRVTKNLSADFLSYLNKGNGRG